MPDARFRAAVTPVLGAIEAVEHTVEHGFGGALPPSTRQVLATFGPHGRVLGHAIDASVFSAGRPDRFTAWLAAYADHRPPVAELSEHVGWSTGGPYAAGAPLPVPETAAAHACAVSRLRQIGAVAGVPLGLENLALAFSRRQARAQGPFVGAVLDAVDGFLHLDLHNLWCQVRNFDLDADALLATWPLHRVRRIHVSGGSEVDGLRRDTHDHAVPEPVWDLLAAVLPEVPDCAAVILEQLPSALGTPEAQAAFRDDFARLRAVRDAQRAAPRSPAATRLPAAAAPPVSPGETLAQLCAWQAAIVAVLADRSGADALRALRDHPASAPYAGWVADLEPRMLTVGSALVAAWGVRQPEAGGPAD